MSIYKFIKTKAISIDKGYYYITPILEIMPPSIGLFIKIDNESVYLQTSYITEEQALAVQELMGELFGEIITVDLDDSAIVKAIDSGHKTGEIENKDLGPIKKENIEVQTPIEYDYGWINSSTGLYIRTEPNLKEAGCAGVLDCGQRFKVDKSFVNSEWIKIIDPIAGYIYREYTSFSNTPQTISQRLVDFTASWEGFSSGPYRDAGGNWTVGFGDCTYNVEPAPVTYQAAWNNLESTLNNLATQVYEITKGMDLNQAQFDSLVDFAYNLGANSLTYSENTDGLLSAILKCNNNQVVLNDFIAWDHCDGQQLLGLKRRRIAESQMFLSGQYNKN